MTNLRRKPTGKEGITPEQRKKVEQHDELVYRLGPACRAGLPSFGERRYRVAKSSQAVQYWCNLQINARRTDTCCQITNENFC